MDSLLLHINYTSIKLIFKKLAQEMDPGPLVPMAHLMILCIFPMTQETPAYMLPCDSRDPWTTEKNS